MSAAQFMAQVDNSIKRSPRIEPVQHDAVTSWHKPVLVLEKKRAETHVCRIRLSYILPHIQLRKVLLCQHKRILIDVPPSNNIGKLCTEDPISVSRQFSLKFHKFFNIIIINGRVLGQLDQFYWKMEYQAHGAPHYHALV